MSAFRCKRFHLILVYPIESSGFELGFGEEYSINFQYWRELGADKS